MARLEFPIAADGLICDVLVGHRASLVAAMQANGHTPPPAVPFRGLIDTGSDRRAVNPSVLAALRLGIPKMQRSRQTAAGPAKVNLFYVSLSILNFQLRPSPMLVQPDLLVVELSTPVPNLDVLIGMDVIRTCKLLVDGPAGVFSLEWVVSNFALLALSSSRPGEHRGLSESRLRRIAAELTIDGKARL